MEEIQQELLQVENENTLLRKSLTNIEVERDKLKLQLKQSRIRNKKLSSQSKKFKEVISFFTSTPEEVQSDEKDILNILSILAIELDVKTDDQSKVRDRVAAVKIPLRKKYKHVKIESIEGEQNTDIDEETDEKSTNLKKTANFNGIKKKQRICQYCGKEFHKKSFLERHERIHTGDPFRKKNEHVETKRNQG